MEKDVTKKRCLSDNCRYADLINGFIFQGKQVVREEDLTELDTQSGIWSSIRRRGKRYTSPGYRDLIRKTAFGVNFAVIGIENQEEVSYLMPLRSMRYDAAEYERQAGQIKKKVRRESGISVTVQTGLRIYCAGRVKERRLRVSAPSRSDLEWADTCNSEGI